MTEKVYSLDGERFYCYDIFMSEILHECEPGDNVNIYVGAKKEVKHSDFVYVGAIIKRAQELAYDMCEEFSDGYLDGITTEDQEEELQKLICDWLEKTVGPPGFYAVESVLKTSITIRKGK